jgi:uncharacterized protein (TIGR03435 family)
MLRVFPYLAGAVFVSALAFGQSTESKPAFEAADVHTSAPTRNPYLRNFGLRNGRYELRYATMVDLIKTAWDIEAEKVLGGPNWLEYDTFDVVAKVPSGTTPETARLMLRTLLADRFKLVLHNDTKPVPTYALKSLKQPKLKQAEGSGESGCQFTPPRASRAWRWASSRASALLLCLPEHDYGRACGCHAQEHFSGAPVSGRTSGSG